MKYKKIKLLKFSQFNLYSYLGKYFCNIMNVLTTETAAHSELYITI